MVSKIYIIVVVIIFGWGGGGDGGVWDKAFSLSSIGYVTV